MSGSHRRCNTYVIRSFLSLSFFRPPNAILVPGMYFFGFSRYSNYATILHQQTRAIPKDNTVRTHQSFFVPDNALLLVGIGVRVACDQARLASEQTVEVRANLVGAALLESVALGATGLEQVRTLGVGALWRDVSAIRSTYPHRGGEGEEERESAYLRRNPLYQS